MCYSGEDNVIHFSDGLNLILGGNGYGKTKLYDAFNWVLFDRITDQEGRLTLYTSKLKQNLISQKALNEAEVGAVAAKVTLELINEEGTHIALERSYKVTIGVDGSVASPDQSRFIIREKGELEYKPVPLEGESDEKDYIRDKVMPPDVFQHIWFQGEKGIKHAVDIGNPKSLSHVINKLSYIDTWEKFIDAAKDTHRRVKGKFHKEVNLSKKHQKEAAQINAEINRIEEQLERKQKELSICRGEAERINEQIDNISLTEEARMELEELRKEEEEIKEEFARLTKRQDNLLGKANRDLFESYWVAYGTEHLAQKYELLYKNYLYIQQDDRRRREEGLPTIPRGNPGPAHIRRMLEDEHCHICNRAAKRDSDAYAHIENLLPENYPKAEEYLDKYKHDDVFTSLNHVQFLIADNASSFEKDFEQQQEDYFKVDDRRKELDEEINKIEEEKAVLLVRLGLESLEAGIRQGSNFKSLNERATEKSSLSGKLESEIERLQEDKAKKEKELKRLVKDDIDSLLSKQYDYFTSLLVAMSDAKEAQYNKLVKLLEKESNRHYEAINKKTGAFYGTIHFKPTVNEGYEPKIYNESNEDVTAQINTSQLLSMRFSILFAILSANKEYGLNKRYPLIADAPNAAFDARKKKFLLKQIGTTFEQSIVMMFEYLENDANRTNRYKIDEEGLKEIKQIMEAEGVPVKVIMLDIPDGVNAKNIKELAIQIKNA